VNGLIRPEVTLKTCKTGAGAQAREVIRGFGAIKQLARHYADWMSPGPVYIRGDPAIYVHSWRHLNAW
jgi:hypothetical protein